MLMRCATIGEGGEARLLAAAKHNLREIGGEHIDASKSHLNVVMAGPATASGVVQLAASRRQATGIVLKRKDATLAGEIIFGLATTTSIDTSAYFKAAMEWVAGTFGADAVLSAVVHYDEAAPHAHILIQPVRNGQWRASDVFGRKPELKTLLDAFYRDVAAGFGLKRAPERLAAADRRALVQDVFAHLKAVAAPVMRCPTWAVVRDQIAKDPIPFAEQLGVPIKRRLKTMAQLKVSAGKGPKRDNTYPV